VTEEDVKDGWHGAPAGEEWVCPSCKQASPIKDWRAGEVDCEDCGSHDARQCPLCEKWFDHVWGSDNIAVATEERISEKRG